MIIRFSRNPEKQSIDIHIFTKYHIENMFFNMPLLHYNVTRNNPNLSRIVSGRDTALSPILFHNN